MAFNHALFRAVDKLLLDDLEQIRQSIQLDEHLRKGPILWKTASTKFNLSIVALILNASQAFSNITHLGLVLDGAQCFSARIGVAPGIEALQKLGCQLRLERQHRNEFHVVRDKQNSNQMYDAVQTGDAASLSTAPSFSSSLFCTIV